MRDRFAGELQAAGRTADVARAEATLLASFTPRRALGWSLSAQEMAERLPAAGAAQGRVAQGARCWSRGLTRTKCLSLSAGLVIVRWWMVMESPFCVHHAEAPVILNRLIADDLATIPVGDAMVGTILLTTKRTRLLQAMAAATLNKALWAATRKVRGFYLSLQNPLIIGLIRTDGNADIRTGRCQVIRMRPPNTLL